MPRHHDPHQGGYGHLLKGADHDLWKWEEEEEEEEEGGKGWVLE